MLVVLVLAAVYVLLFMIMMKILIMIFLIFVLWITLSVKSSLSVLKMKLLLLLKKLNLRQMRKKQKLYPESHRRKMEPGSKSQQPKLNGALNPGGASVPGAQVGPEQGGRPREARPREDDAASPISAPGDAAAKPVSALAVGSQRMPIYELKTRQRLLFDNWSQVNLSDGKNYGCLLDNSGNP